MTNLITKYQEFLFEAEGINAKIEQTKLEIAKIHDEITAAKEEAKNKKKSDPDNVTADIDSIKKQAVSYGKLPALMNTLASQMAESAKQKSSANIY
jgi:hypothetical protein